MRLSYSLNDFKTPVRSELGGSEFDLEINKSNTIHNKPIRALQRDGPSASSFSKEKMSSTNSSTWKRYSRKVILGFLIISLLIFLIYISARYYNNSFSHSSSEYVVILDCGSTGTRVYVYEWSIIQGSDHTDLPFVLKSLPEDPLKKSTARIGRAYQRMETEPGFGKLVHNESGLKSAIKPLLKWAEKQIPINAHKRTSLFLYATAGVRRLPTADSEWLLENAWSIMRKSSFSCQRDWVKIITGMEEAYYGWIALNYQMGMLGSLSKETYGALDMGGSSLQVTFETESPIHDETGIDLSMGAANHHLSAYSLAGYGLNDAFDRSVAYLLRSMGPVSNSEKIELRHPCLHTGYQEEYTCSQCGMLSQDGSPLMSGRNVKERKPGVLIELIGEPDWEKCNIIAKATVNQSEWLNLSSALDCKLSPCALTENLPLPRGHFYAMSGFFVVYKFFNLSAEATLDDVLKLGRSFCDESWENAKNSVAPQPFIEQYCFRAPYIVSLIRDGLHIPDSEVLIGSGSITWTLGVALLEAGQAFSRKMEFRGYNILHARIKPVVLVIVILASLTLLCCAISYAYSWTPNLFRRSYLPLYKNSVASPSILNFQRWSPTADGRVKTPLSPTIADSEQHPFAMGGSNVQLSNSPFQQSVSGRSFSSGSLGQLQFGNGMGSSFMTPLRGQTLQSRRSQSREDLSSSLVDAHVPKT